MSSTKTLNYFKKLNLYFVAEKSNFYAQLIYALMIIIVLLNCRF